VRSPICLAAALAADLRRTLVQEQFKTISIGVEDRVETSRRDMLRTVEPATDPVLEIPNAGAVWRYPIGGNYRVEVLTPGHVHLPEVQIDGKPYSHLDCLMYPGGQAVVLHGACVALNHAAPERYCLRKLMVIRRFADSQVKVLQDRQRAIELTLAQNILAAARAADALPQAGVGGGGWFWTTPYRLGQL